MLLFIDSADPKQVREMWELGRIDGVTTNPSLASKIDKSYKDIVQELLDIVDGPVSLEVIAVDYKGMLNEARSLSNLHENVYVKIPCTDEGFKAVKTLREEDIKVNMTLCFSVNQALLAAKAGANYISPFIGRLDDISMHSGDELIKKIRKVYDNYDFDTLILDASIRDAEHVERSALMGADIATVPYDILKEMSQHSLTDKGLNKFLEDWKESGLKLPV